MEILCNAEWKFLCVFKVLGNFRVNKVIRAPLSHENIRAYGAAEPSLRMGELFRELRLQENMSLLSKQKQSTSFVKW